MKQGPETAKNNAARIASGFYRRFLKDTFVNPGHGLDIGCGKNRAPVTPNAIGIDKHYPGYDGIHLPFPDESQYFVYSSHCLEHIPTEHLHETLREWFRVIKVSHHLIITVPHQHLYEKVRSLPSIFNPDHKRFYTPASLLQEIEEALPVNHYRVISLRDNDDNFDYSIPPEQHSTGSYEIELVLQKIPPPQWQLA
jgi:SAM-dependent methyltransferase